MIRFLIVLVHLAGRSEILAHSRKGMLAIEQICASRLPLDYILSRLSDHERPRFSLQSQ